MSNVKQMPLIWALKSSRSGENSQILMLSKALSSRYGWPVKVMTLNYRLWSSGLGLLRGKGFGGVNLTISDALQPPWPDILVSGSLSNEPVARQIQALSGGRTKLVFLGRTWADDDLFDLIITTPQYRLPERPNILHNLLTISEHSHVGLANGVRQASSRWPNLSPPYLTVLLGGRSGSFMLGPHATRRLVVLVNRLAAKMNASVLATTSARTHPDVAEIFCTALTVPHHFHRFQLNQEANPYAAMMAAGSRFIVTGDSVAMLSEAIITGRPVYIFDLGAGKRTMRQMRTLGRLDRTLATELYSALTKLAPKRLSRDLWLVHSRLVEAHYAAWLGDDEPKWVAVTSSLQSALSRIRMLVEE